jgi:hypothetical protein
VAGEALERLYAGRLEEIADRLAHHFARAERASKAVAYLVRVAERAARPYAHVEAAAVLREALRQAERLSEEEREGQLTALSLRLAHSLYFLGQFPEAPGTRCGRRAVCQLVGVVATLLGLAVPSWSGDLERGAGRRRWPRWRRSGGVTTWGPRCARVADGGRRGPRREALGGARRRRRCIAPLGAVPGIHELPEAGARRMNVEALFRARQQRSLRGIVQVAQRFAWLGDMEVVERSLRMTDSLAPTVAANAKTIVALEILRVRSVLRLPQASEGASVHP